MNFRLSWIGFRDLPVAEALDRAGLIEDPLASDFSVTRLDNGWTVLIADDEELGFMTPRRMAALSSGLEVVGVTLLERFTTSMACGYRDGERLWAVFHDPEMADGSDNLDVEGEPPPVFAEILEPLRGRQARSDARRGDVDLLYDAPLDLAQALVGFRHDESDPAREARFVFARRAPDCGPDRLDERWDSAWWSIRDRVVAPPPPVDAPVWRKLEAAEPVRAPRWRRMARCAAGAAAGLAVLHALMIVTGVALLLPLHGRSPFIMDGLAVGVLGGALPAALLILFANYLRQTSTPSVRLLLLLNIWMLSMLNLVASAALATFWAPLPLLGVLAILGLVGLWGGVRLRRLRWMIEQGRRAP